MERDQCHGHPECWLQCRLNAVNAVAKQVAAVAPSSSATPQASPGASSERHGVCYTCRCCRGGDDSSVSGGDREGSYGSGGRVAAAAAGCVRGRQAVEHGVAAAIGQRRRRRRRGRWRRRQGRRRPEAAVTVAAAAAAAASCGAQSTLSLQVLAKQWQRKRATGAAVLGSSSMAGLVPMWARAAAAIEAGSGAGGGRDGGGGRTGGAESVTRHLHRPHRRPSRRRSLPIPPLHRSPTSAAVHAAARAIVAPAPPNRCRHFDSTAPGAARHPRDGTALPVRGRSSEAPARGLRVRRAPVKRGAPAEGLQPGRPRERTPAGRRGRWRKGPAGSGRLRRRRLPVVRAGAAPPVRAGCGVRRRRCGGQAAAGPLASAARKAGSVRRGGAPPSRPSDA
jgi:hypothetical protein